MTTDSDDRASDVPPPVLDAVRSASRVAVLTGAGMSAQSGVPTFRDAQTGLWERYSPEELASPDAFVRDPDLVWAWYRRRAQLVAASSPNAGHVALAQWQRSAPQQTVEIATQNVDDLHERAGSTVLAHVHGTLAAVRCSICEEPFEGPVDDVEDGAERIAPPACGLCGSPVRPGVVWFGEPLPEAEWAAVAASVEAADVVLVVGTSGVVYPFAGLPAQARSAGAVVIEINPDETAVSDMTHHVWRATAAGSLPALVAAVTEQQR
ncbi:MULTISPECIES: NAD-dependent deacylase [Nocardiaceae]|uniref:NAD-dependent protein deacylase n=1 Tax=Rhodococcoides corynebacterioides TaxID=53972 RepID=A0ABS2KUP7_9NOCA|nr:MULTISPECIES: NAD-dependent deacylase [Rhodococcus]MBM7415669.1 NAD-dependent deacetylase [Rhodococcus corynebacterioides]MBP1118131.1 NAD-dependent deacetylase [Rhodococcus sp. PvP016]